VRRFIGYTLNYQASISCIKLGNYDVIYSHFLALRKQIINQLPLGPDSRDHMQHFVLSYNKYLFLTTGDASPVSKQGESFRVSLNCRTCQRLLPANYTGTSHVLQAMFAAKIFGQVYTRTVEANLYDPRSELYSNSYLFDM